MRDLVRDGRAADEVGREDQPPAVADRAARSSSCPSARPDRRRRPRRRATPALAANSRVSRVEQRQRLGLEPAQDAALEPFERAAGDAAARRSTLDPARPRRIPVDPMRLAVERDASRPARTASASGIAASARSIQSRCPAAQASARRCETRRGTVSSTARVRGSTRSRIRRARGDTLSVTGAPPMLRLRASRSTR